MSNTFICNPCGPRYTVSCKVGIGSEDYYLLVGIDPQSYVSTIRPCLSILLYAVVGTSTQTWTVRHAIRERTDALQHDLLLHLLSPRKYGVD